MTSVNNIDIDHVLLIKALILIKSLLCCIDLFPGFNAMYLK